MREAEEMRILATVITAIEFRIELGPPRKFSRCTYTQFLGHIRDGRKLLDCRVQGPGSKGLRLALQRLGKLD